jgi:ankyrin repeat protein
VPRVEREKELIVIRKSPSTRTLTERPNLEQLKRQAKELLAAYRAGQPDAIAEVTAHFHAAHRATFALHDAQLVLARAYGYDSWPKLKAYVDGVTISRLVGAVRSGDIVAVRAMLARRPELADMDMAATNEHRPLHYAVLDRAPEMVRLLMQHGADARKGIYPHRAATSALTIATERGYAEIVAIIEDEEQRRREASSAATAPAAAAGDELCDAIETGDHARGLAMLEANPALVHARHRDGWTPLHAAAAALDEAMAAWLLDHGADANARGRDNRTPLDVGAALPRWRRPESAAQFARMAALLRGHGAALAARSAVALGEADWLRARHAEGALVNAIAVDVFEPSNGLLSIAVKHGRPEMVLLLLDFGFDPNERTRVDGLDELEFTSGQPLWIAAASGKLPLAEILLQRGADPNASVYASGSPLSAAYGHGRREPRMIELLTRHGGVVTPVMAGLYRETGRARDMLSGAGQAPVSDDTHAGHTVAEQLLWGGACGGDPEIVRMALERVDWPRDNPRWYRMLEQPLRIWNHGPWPWAKLDWDRSTYVTCFRLMLERCDPNVRGRFGLTMLHDVAASREQVTADERVAFSTLLLDAGARLDGRDELLKSTPLGWACRWGRTELVRLLLERGADPIEREAEPWATPMAWAEKMRHNDVRALLRRI